MCCKRVHAVWGVLRAGSPWFTLFVTALYNSTLDFSSDPLLRDWFCGVVKVHNVVKHGSATVDVTPLLLRWCSSRVRRTLRADRSPHGTDTRELFEATGNPENTEQYEVTMSGRCVRALCGSQSESQRSVSVG